MNDAIRAPQQTYHPATLRLPVAFDFPLGGILGRTAIGTALLAIGCVMLIQAGVLWILGGAFLGLLGGLAAISNLRALLDSDRRKIVLDDDGVEIRYGFSRRRYRFLEYSDYRISRLGFRRFLTALPIDVDRSLGERAQRVRLTLYDRPAFLTPMPMLGDGAPASLLEWQSTLNELRRAAVAAAGLTAELERDASEAGARPSRLSRRAYARGRIILGLVFLALLLAPMGFAVAVKHGIIAVCGSAGGSGCLGIDPVFHQIVMIGGPGLAILVFVLGSARMTIRRAHDLDEDMPFWRAALDPLSRRDALRRRLNGEEGTAGTNRFGPAPADSTPHS